MDQVELRRVNDTQKRPINGAPYTSRSSMQYYDEAAKAFGWSKRSATTQPSTMLQPCVCVSRPMAKRASKSRPTMSPAKKA